MLELSSINGPAVTVAATGETFAEGDVLPWTWRECTLLRVIDAYEFCLTNKLPRGSWAEKKAGTQSRAGTAPFEGMDKVFAAIGLAPGERPARRAGRKWEAGGRRLALRKGGLRNLPKEREAGKVGRPNRCPREGWGTK